MSISARTRLLVVLLAGVLTATGCMHSNAAVDGAAASTGTPEQTWVFECPDDYSFVARTRGDSIWLFLPGLTVELPKAASANGSRYSDGSTVFLIDGDRSDLETASARYAGCRNNRALAIWEHAKLSGVDFRATGNEPGWTLEISNRYDILVVTDYGQTTYRFPSASLESKPDSRTTIYRARNENDSAEIVITPGPCRDSMSGEAFSAAVSVRINDREYRGCGRALH